MTAGFSLILCVCGDFGLLETSVSQPVWHQHEAFMLHNMKEEAYEEDMLEERGRPFVLF